MLAVGRGLIAASSGDLRSQIGPGQGIVPRRGVMMCAVLEAAIIGLPDEEWGEVVTAVVARKPGMEVGGEELIECCRAALAGYKKPRRVVFLDELPKTPSGKILKRELRSLLAGAPGST